MNCGSGWLYSDNLIGSSINGVIACTALLAPIHEFIQTVVSNHAAQGMAGHNDPLIASDLVFQDAGDGCCGPV